jgi:putative peptidoglycan lipid II flippase
MISKILNSKTKTVAFAAFLLAVSGLISRILGLFRDRLIANRLGAGDLSDIYFAAFRVPDFVYGILVAGGITSIFLPILSEYFEKGSPPAGGRKDQWPEQALNLASNVLNCFLFLVVLICGILAILAPVIAKFIVPGFSEENRDLTVALTRIMFLSPVIFGVSSIFSVILHYFNKFLCYSLAPILYNLGIIFGILFFFPKFGVFGLGLGVILGACLHLLIQLPAAINSGFNYRFILNFKHPGIKNILKLMAPRIVGIAAYNLNLIAIVSIASLLVAGSVSVFSYANNLYYLPIGLVGIPFAISSFPLLSKFWASGKKEEFQKKLFFFPAPDNIFCRACGVIAFSFEGSGSKAGFGKRKIRLVGD